jgi:hypothetical protein
MKPAREAMQKVVAQRMTQFGQAGHAGDYKPHRIITEIAKGYANGTLTHPAAGRRQVSPFSAASSVVPYAT